MDCRPGCGACCIAPSISSSIPGMPQGKPANIRCYQLDESNHCKIFGQADRPQVCRSFAATEDMCGNGMHEAMERLADLEALTR